MSRPMPDCGDYDEYLSNCPWNQADPIYCDNHPDTELVGDDCPECDKLWGSLNKLL